MNHPEVSRASQTKSTCTNTDLIVKAYVNRSEIQMLCKLVEGLGHLGVVTTTNKESGEVMLQTTKDCWVDLKKAIEKMPFKIEFLQCIEE